MTGGDERVVTGMKVTVLSQYYEPEPVHRPVDLAKHLAAAGHSVMVLTGFPQYPVGRTYPGYHVRGLTRQTLDGIPVVRAFEYPYHGKSVARRVANYMSFAASATVAGRFLPRPDVVYVRHPPLTIGLAAAALSRVWRCPFVYDVQDIWPESALLSGLMTEGAMVRLMRRIERFVYRRAARIIAVTPEARQNIIGKGVPADRVVVLPGWADDSAFDRVPDAEVSSLREELGWAGRFVVVFAGNLGIVQGLDTIIEAAGILRRDRVLIALVGDGSERERLQERVEREGLADSVRFLGMRPSADMPKIFASADALLVHLKACELDEYVVPAKILSYLAAGRPVVAAMGGAGARLLHDAQAGPVVAPERPGELADAIRELQAKPAVERAALARCGLSFAREHCKRDRVIRLYEALLQSASGVGGGIDTTTRTSPAA